MIYPRIHYTFTLMVLCLIFSAIAAPAPGPTATSDPHARDYRPYNDGVSGERYFQIHPGYDETKCLDVRESGYADGTPVDM